MNKKHIVTQWNDLQVEATLIEGDWEGDPSIPRGTHILPPYIEDLTVTTTDGTDMLCYLTEDAEQQIQEYLLDEYNWAG